MTLELGGVYSLVLREYNGNIAVSLSGLFFFRKSRENPTLKTWRNFPFQFAKLYAMTPPNTIHMFWIVPQYVFLSVAEVMFAISGLEFSFTQVRILSSGFQIVRELRKGSRR